jgi:DNA-binding MarR family transcriptional regulator
MGQEHKFAELLTQVAREVTRRQSSDVCCGDLTLEQYRTLQAVSAVEQMTIGSLSTQLRVDLSTMSRNVSVLERSGYLVRTRSAEDGRVVHVRLTSKGTRALETLRCGERDIFKDVYQQLAPAERSGVVKALEALRCCLGNTDAGGAACCGPSPARKGAS